MSGIRRRAIEGLRPGDAFTLVRTFTEELSRAFGELSRDYNPVHHDRRFAEAKGFTGLICHGLLVGSLVTEVGGQIGWLATGMEFRFLKPVYFGDTITCRFTLAEIDERGRARGQATFTNQHGTTVIEATLAGRLPGEPERAVLAALIAEGDPTGEAGSGRPDPEVPRRPG
jgi:acyl dehydratase